LILSIKELFFCFEKNKIKGLIYEGVDSPLLPNGYQTVSTLGPIQQQKLDGYPGMNTTALSVALLID
jgi:hypothetical protein